MAPPIEEVYCTLVTSDSYVIGALVVAYSLCQSGASRPLVALVTPEVSEPRRVELSHHFTQLIPMSTVSNTTTSTSALSLMGRPELASTFTKLALWSQTRFRRIVYVDADVMVLKNPDELFDIKLSDNSIAAAPELGFPDHLNSGVMVLSPSIEVYEELMALASKGTSIDGGDQGVINMFFNHDRAEKKWHRFSFLYNVELYKMYRLNMPAIRHHREDVRIVHFIGREKPWTLGEDDLEGDGSAYAGFYGEMVRRWWGLAEEVRAADGGPKCALSKEDSGVEMPS